MKSAKKPCCASEAGSEPGPLLEEDRWTLVEKLKIEIRSTQACCQE